MKTKIMLAALIILILATVWVVYAAEQARNRAKNRQLHESILQVTLHAPSGAFFIAIHKS